MLPKKLVFVFRVARNIKNIVAPCKLKSPNTQIRYRPTFPNILLLPIDSNRILISKALQLNCVEQVTDCLCPSECRSFGFYFIQFIKLFRLLDSALPCVYFLVSVNDELVLLVRVIYYSIASLCFHMHVFDVFVLCIC